MTAIVTDTRNATTHTETVITSGTHRGPAGLASASAPATVPAARSTIIDLYTPVEAGRALNLDDQGLIELVNAGTLAAYRFDDAIRFRSADVRGLARQLVAV